MNKKIFSWCLYDFANSSYSAVIAATIFPVYYANFIVGNDSGAGDLWWGRAIAVSMAIVAISSPILGGIADYSNTRKRMLLCFTLLCIFAVASFSFLQKGMVIEGFTLMVIANIGMESSIIFYNAFLPIISKQTHQGRVSAWGFGIGYAGSIFSLIIALIMVKHNMIGYAWSMVALFFMMFSVPAFVFLPGDEKKGVPQKSFMKKHPMIYANYGFKETAKHIKMIWSKKDQRRFLLAYLIYEDGVNTVIVFSSIFAATTLGFMPEELIYMYLVVQATALTGVLTMARAIDYWGPKKVVCLSLLIWIAITIAAYFVNNKLYFMLIASVAGLSLGTIQAATRAFYTQFISKGMESEYFGVYNLVGKSSAILGPIVFGAMSSTFGSQRPAVLSVSLFFVIGYFILRTVDGGKPNVT
ncbi:MAG TPA: MFS transporter [Syntrophorhabdaceae bacterium]|nr:MFS transporter [Syntrophorhabdaceae bacterium]